MEIIPDKRKVIGLVEQSYEGRSASPTFNATSYGLAKR
jgi:hypothetical protein